MRKGIGLNFKMNFTVSLAVAILATALVSIMIASMNYLADAILQETMLPLARTASMSVRGSLQDLADRIFLIKDNAVFTDSRSGREEQQQALDVAASGIEFVWLGFYDPEGRLQAGSYRSPPNVHNSVFFPMMKETRNLVVDDVHVGSSGQLEIVIGSPVHIGQSDSYYLVGSYKYDVLNDVLGNINVSSGSTAYIINEAGKFMAHRNMDYVRFGASIFWSYPPGPELERVLSKMSRGEIGSARLGLGGEQRIFSFAPVRGTRWALVIEVPLSDYKAVIRQGVFVSILSTLLLLLAFSIYSGLFIQRLMITPLKTITENARKLSRGAFGHEMPDRLLKRPDEIGQLAFAFVSMSGAFEKVIGEIEQIAYAAEEGRLKQRSRLSSLEGNFGRIISGVNSALDLICSHLDAIPVALALLNEKREMLYRNSTMDYFLLMHDLDCFDTRLLEQIAGGGNSSPDDALDPQAANIFDPALASPGPFTTDIAMMGHDGATSYTLTIQRAGLNSREQNSLCVILMLSDVTMLTRAKIDAEAASRTKSDFLSRMSHEIRTPMNAIMGMTQIAKNTNEVRKIKDCLEQVENSSQHLLGVIDDILDFSKIESGKLKLDITEFSLHEDLDFVVSMMLSRAKQRDISIRLNIENIRNDGISIDSLRLNQVLINLLSNAVKFSSQGSEVLLNVRELEPDSPEASVDQDLFPDGSHTAHGFSVFRFEVVDHGIGISEYNAAKLFRPFEQADGGITRNYGGTGLGLVISKNLVELMGGEISLKSVEGEGSTFAFTIRCAAKPHAEKADKGRVKSVNVADFDFSGKRCLVIDDVDINREIILELLSGTGLSLETAENGKEALDKFKAAGENYYHAILMDMQMPIMDGCTAAREIRALESERQKSVPIIAMTANVMQEDVKMALNSGMNAHLGKPIDLEAMLKVLAQYLAYA